MTDASLSKLVPPLTDSIIRYNVVLDLPVSARTFEVEESYITSQSTEMSGTYYLLHPEDLFVLLCVPI